MFLFKAHQNNTETLQGNKSEACMKLYTLVMKKAYKA